MMSRETRGERARNHPTPPSSAGNQAGISTEHIYHGRRDPTAPVGEECMVTVDGEPVDYRYDLLSASPSGLDWGYGGSGPAQLAIAMLAHAFDDEFACQHYQRFKREVVSELPEEDWTLTKRDLDAWREEVVRDA